MAGPWSSGRQSPDVAPGHRDHRARGPDPIAQRRSSDGIPFVASTIRMSFDSAATCVSVSGQSFVLPVTRPQDRRRPGPSRWPSTRSGDESRGTTCREMGRSSRISRRTGTAPCTTGSRSPSPCLGVSPRARSWSTAAAEVVTSGPPELHAAPVGRRPVPPREITPDRLPGPRDQGHGGDLLGLVPPEDGLPWKLKGSTWSRGPLPAGPERHGRLPVRP